LCGLQLLNLENQIYIPEGIVVPKRMCPNKNKDKNREKFIIFNSGEFKNKNNVHDSGHIVGVNFKFVIRKLSCEYGRWVRMILDLDSPSNFLYK